MSLAVVALGEGLQLPLNVASKGATIVLFDSSVTALAAMHLVTQGLDAGETSVLKVKFSVDLLKTLQLKVIPSSACVVSYSVLLATNPAELERIMTGALSVPGFTGKLSFSEGQNGYQDVRELKKKDAESVYLSRIGSQRFHLLEYGAMAVAAI